MWFVPTRHALPGTPSNPVQHTSIRYTEWLGEARAEPSIRSVGDSYDHAMAESIVGLFRAELIRRRVPWRGQNEVEIASLERLDCSTTDASSKPWATSHEQKPETNHYLTQPSFETLKMTELSLL
jgi:putative transposase